jgi:hypothetical protein
VSAAPIPTAKTPPRVSALSGSPHHEFITDLYTYLISKPECSTSDSRKALIRRIREALVKDVSIVGVCKPIDAIILLDAIERPEDKDYSFSRYECSKNAPCTALHKEN